MPPSPPPPDGIFFYDFRCSSRYSDVSDIRDCSAERFRRFHVSFMTCLETSSGISTRLPSLLENDIYRIRRHLNRAYRLLFAASSQSIPSFEIAENVFEVLFLFSRRPVLPVYCIFIPVRSRAHQTRAIILVRYVLASDLHYRGVFPPEKFSGQSP